MFFKRNRTPTKHIYYALHLYFSGLSLRKVSQNLSPFIKRNHVSIWNWIQQYKCNFLKLKHHIQLPYEKSIIIERTIQYVKDRTESFDDYFPCRSERRCKLEHISNWFKMFIDMHNRGIIYSSIK